MAGFLGAFRSKRVGLLIALGFASGLPFSMRGSTLSAWMMNAGVDLRTIGLFTLVGLFYTAKFVWAPLLDRFRLPWLGRRCGWMAATQLGLCAGIAAMGMVDPRSAPAALAALAALTTLLSATQDIASDAYRTDVLPPSERASGTATFIMGYRIAMLLAGAGALILSDHLPWPSVYLVMAGLMGVGLVASWAAPEPDPVRPPATLRAAVVHPFVEFFSRPGAMCAIAFIALYKFGDYVAADMITPFLIKTGFSNTEIGAVTKAFGMVATIVGVLVGGGLCAKLGVRCALLGFGILQAAANSGYLALALVGKSHTLLVAAIAIDCFCGGLSSAAFSAYIMSLCNQSFSATQYALLSSASVVLGRLFGGSAGYLVMAVSWPIFFAGTMAVAVPALVLLAFVPSSESTRET